MKTTAGEANNLSQIEKLQHRVGQLEAVIVAAINEDADSLASRYINEKMDNLNAPRREKIGRVEMMDEVISLVYEKYFMYNRNFHGVDCDRTIQMRNLIHDLRELQAHEMEK